jgi:hypothetical protein
MVSIWQVICQKRSCLGDFYARIIDMLVVGAGALPKSVKFSMLLSTLLDQHRQPLVAVSGALGALREAVELTDTFMKPKLTAALDALSVDYSFR